ncbi:MAG: metallophosphoesterase family protein [Clostridia bacterium]|nr:metallophosphoesterase family protein [Clostridia bacterium]
MQRKPLKFNNGKFKILLFGDLHESYDMSGENAAAKSEDASNLMSKALDELKPDMVILLGDNARADSEMQMRSVISRIVYPISLRDIPMDLVFGNHDRECNVTLEEQIKLYNENENCYLRDDDPTITGTGNHYLTIKSSDGKRDVLNLWFLDSNNLVEGSQNYNLTVTDYDCVHKDQIEWYKKTAQKLAEDNGGKVIPAFLFQHIPVQEEYELLREAKPYEILDSVKGHGIFSDKYYVLKPEVEGYLGEGPCTPDENSGEFAAWKEIGDVMGAFFGHDHMNDFAGFVDGILLAQSKTAGFRPYTDGCRAGVRLITVDENDVENFTTQMYHFKEFGLKSKSLGPVQRNITDRQDMKLKIAGAAMGTAALVTAAAVTSKKLKNRKTGK